MQAAQHRIEDWRTFSVDAAIAAATIGDGAVEVEWSDTRRSPFHFDWLRDNCACSACVHAVTREQVFEIADAREDLSALVVHVDTDGALHVEWNEASQYLVAGMVARACIRRCVARRASGRARAVRVDRRRRDGDRRVRMA